MKSTSEHVTKIIKVARLDLSHSDGGRIGSWEHGETKIDLNMCILVSKNDLLCCDGLSRSCGVST